MFSLASNPFRGYYRNTCPVDEPKENLEVGAVDKASEHDATENDQKTSTEATLQTEEKSDDMNYTYINRYMRHIICRFFDIK